LGGLIRGIATDGLCGSRTRDWGKQPDFHRLRFDDHAFDMALDQLTIVHRWLGLSRGKMVANALEHQRLDFGGGHTPDLPATALRFCKSACDT
jgi:hypothetical protein